MTYPEYNPSTAQELDAVIGTIEFLSVDDAPVYLRNEVHQRVVDLSPYISTAPDATQLANQLAEFDVDRVIYLIGTARPALQLMAAAIVELGVTVAKIEEVIRWMDVRPVGMNPLQGYLGIDIAYIVSFRLLTREQRWLLHSLSWWAVAPATISRRHAIAVAQVSGRLLDMNVEDTDLDRLQTLAFVTPYQMSDELAPDIPISKITTERLRMEPYIRYIAQSGLEDWPIPPTAPETIAEMSAVQLVAFLLVDWATSFARVVAGPTINAELQDNAKMTENDSEDDDDDAPNLTPDPELAELTNDEMWAALEPEIPHLIRAITTARELKTVQHIFVLCQLLIPRLRQRSEPQAYSLRHVLLETGLISSRADKSLPETFTLATQLADLSLDEQDSERAESFAKEALNAALGTKHMQSISFATRRLAAISLRNNHVATAKELARQSVALARSNGDQVELTESIALLDTAMRMDREQTSSEEE